MSITLNKSTGINLKKGSTISLKKQGQPLKNICIGLNWGAIERGTLMNILLGKKNVDLDGSVTIFDKEGEEIDTVYYRKLLSRDGSIRHSGDDTTGDTNGDDGLDNEVIRINLTKVHPKAHEIYFYLNSFKGQDFASIPYSKIRIYEGTPKEVDNVLATFNLSSDEKFKGNVTMMMGKLYKNEDNWEFKTLGDPIPAKNIKQTIRYIKENFYQKEEA